MKLILNFISRFAVYRQKGGIMKKYYKKILLLCGAAVMLSAMMLAGCASQPSASSDVSLSNDNKKLNVITSFYPMYDFAKKIGGEYVDVTNLVPAGTEPHDWEPSTTDITSLEHADVFVYNGAGMESWTDKVLSTLSNKSLTTVEASQNISLREGGKHEHEHDEDENHTNEENHDEEHYDPHVWLNPLNAKKEMENIKDAFVKTDPEHKQYYENNYKAWSDECDRLYNEYQEALNQVKTKNLVVSHEAFGYLCDAFGLNQMGIQGLEPDSEPDPAHMAEIIDFVKANQVKVIFSEELVSPKVAQSIANATGAQLEVLNPIEGLTNTQLENGDDYFTVMRENLTALKKALN